MNPRLLHLYESELRHLREMGGEFARDFPKIAGRLGLEAQECADPYVERLLEGFSFLAARVQMTIDAQFPRFTNHLLELVYPHYLAPTPAMAVVQLHPDLDEGSLAQGYTVARGSALHGQLGKDDQTACEFRTAHDVTLWPVELAEARYFACGSQMDGIDLARLGGVKAALRLRLRAGAGLAVAELALERLPLYLRGAGALATRLLEALLAHAAGAVAFAPGAPHAWHEFLPRAALRAMGSADDEALLPTGARSFRGYRLLQEYFALPQRFLFVELGGLATAVRRCAGPELEIVVLFDRHDPVLEALTAASFGLYCTPAINLFPKRADRIHLTDRQADHHVVPDRTRPLDFEVYQVTGVTGYGNGPDAVRRFDSFYRANDLRTDAPAAYYQVRRDTRRLSDRARRQGPRSSYVGSEIFLTLVDAAAAPFDSALRQLGVDTLCSNRDLVLSMPLGGGRTDFTIASGAPVKSVRCVTGPTAPAPSRAEGETAWRLASHLSLNYLSLLDGEAGEGGEGAGALRDMLRLYCGTADTAAHRQIDGIRSVHAESIVRRLPVPGPIAYGRGLRVTVTVDEEAFEGVGAFILGMVLDRFFAGYASLNAFTETVVASTARGALVAWPARAGQCAIL